MSNETLCDVPHCHVWRDVSSFEVTSRYTKRIMPHENRTMNLAIEMLNLIPCENRTTFRAKLNTVQKRTKMVPSQKAACVNLEKSAKHTPNHDTKYLKGDLKLNSRAVIMSHAVT